MAENGGTATKERGSPAPQAVTVSDGQPFTLTGEYVELNGTELTCLVHHLALKADVTKETATTICGAMDYPGPVKWVLGFTLYQSFTPAGTYATLQAAIDAGQPVPFLVRHKKGSPAGPDNPEFSGSVIPQPANIYDTDAGALVDVVLEWSLTGAPTVATGP